jgi:hypothetical protein
MAGSPVLAQEPAGQGGQPSAAEIGKKLSNPVSDVWALFTEFDFAFNEGDLPGGDGKVTYSTLFQPILPISLTENYRLITRPTIPIVWSTPVPRSNRAGGVDFNRKTGLGDMLLPLLLSPVEPFKFAGGDVVGGIGPTWLFPTSTNDALGKQKWGLGPAGVLVWKNDKVTVGTFPQYWWSIADRSSNRPKMSQGSFLYFFFYNLPDAWQVGFNPSITFDAEASSDNKWNVPIGITVAKTIKIGNMPVKFQLGGEWSPVRQDDYGKQFLIKLNIIPVIQPLIKGTLF